MDGGEGGIEKLCQRVREENREVRESWYRRRGRE